MPPSHRRRCFASALLALLLLPASASAAPQRTWSFLTTGNGHGFQVFDTAQKKITTFLEHPYRYLRPNGDPRSDGVGRRNLAFDFYFGLKTPTQSGWLNAASSLDGEYVDDSNIIHTPLAFGGVNADAYYFAPFGYEGNALVAIVKAPGAQAAYALFNFHLGSGGSDTLPGADGEKLRYVADAKAVVESGPGGGAMVYVPLSGVDEQDCDGVYGKVQGGGGLGSKTDCAGNDVVPAFGKTLGSDGAWAVAMQFVEDPAQADAAAKALRSWAGTRAPLDLLADARAEFEKWRKPPPSQVTLSPDERHVWRQGEAVLRMGQVREPNTSARKSHGMMLASLPPGEWHTGWVRDGVYATVALARSGHAAEAKASLDFFLNAGPVGKFKQYVKNQDYRISVVRYFGTGEEQADYSGQPSPNVEIDGWGLVLWAARQYVDASGDVAWLSSQTTLGKSVYDVLKSGVADPLLANLESNGVAAADSSIWEVHQDNKRHYAYTSLAAARGLCDMATLASRAAKMGDIGKYADASTKLARAFNGAGPFLDSTGAVVGSLEGPTIHKDTDASAIEALNWGIVDAKGKVGTATLKKLNKLLVSSGGYKRNDDNQSSYDNNEWILVDLRMADAMRRAGSTAPADALIKLVVDKASANFWLLPELYNAVPQDGAIGKYTGSIPMVGYGGGAFLLTMLDRAGLYEPGDCAQSVVTDGGVVMNDGGGKPFGGDDGGAAAGAAPYGVDACLCAAPGTRSTARAGTLALLGAPWLLVAGALSLRARRRRRQRRGAR